MSTIFFSAEELARCALLSVGNTSSDSGKRELRWLLEGLTDYSKANAAAYEKRYPGEKAEPATFELLEYAAKRERHTINHVDEVRKVHGTAGLLRYNLDDEATAEALHPIVTILCSLLRRATATR